MRDELVIRLRMPRLTVRQRLLAVVGAVVVGGAALVHAAAPSPFAAGDTLSAAKLNSNFTAVQEQITTPTFGTRVPSAFHASVTTAASVTGSQYVVFNHAEFDLGGEYNTTTGTFTAKNAGVYLVTCNVFFTPDGTPATFGLIIYKNNSSEVSIVDTQSGTSTSDVGGIAPAAIATVQLAAGDTLRCAAGDETGATRDLDTNNAARNTFSATRLY